MRYTRVISGSKRCAPCALRSTSVDAEGERAGGSVDLRIYGSTWRYGQVPKSSAISLSIVTVGIPSHEISHSNVTALKIHGVRGWPVGPYDFMNGSPSAPLSLPCCQSFVNQGLSPDTFEQTEPWAIPGRQRSTLEKGNA